MPARDDCEKIRWMGWALLGRSTQAGEAGVACFTPTLTKACVFTKLL